MERDDSEQDLDKKMKRVKLNDQNTPNDSSKKQSRSLGVDGNSNDGGILISSWNVNGLRAVNGRGDLKKYLDSKRIDIICLNETKIDQSILDKEDICGFVPSDYHKYYNCCKTKKGYSGVAIFTKILPINITYGIGMSKHDNEGRALTLEFDKFFLVSSYVPNAGQKLERLSYRTKEWDLDFRQYLNNLKKQKPTILTGDLNVAHNDIDITNPKGNKKSAGFTAEERKEFSALLDDGWVDSFRHLYPDTIKYSYFNARSDAREQNKGWRLDYFVIDKEHIDAVVDSGINETVYGSDHLPVELTLDMNRL